jgi:7,8-dihydropterin-6-yl-methyl-4-(beta-D-ribofuranosyl)aminobenzene 5'-phosphate synthase
MQKIKEVEGLSVTCVVDNYYDALRGDPPCGKRFRTKPSSSIYAEHGLSFYVVVRKGYSSYSLLFDFGVDGNVLLHNLHVLGIDPKTVDALVLSHGHFDHYGGLMALVEKLGPSAIPFYAGEGAFTKRFSKRDGEEITDLGRLERERLERKAVRIEETESIREIIQGAYLTGKIEMRTAYEKVPESLLVEREGRIERDDFREERALFFSVKGRGLVVLSGCAHRGIVNTVREAVELSGVEKVYAIMGGFHLINADEERIIRTIEEIKALSPTYLVPMHCTGFEALVAFSQIMSENFIANTVGTTYSL